jgi:Ohr subfamily peroxiredoxin
MKIKALYRTAARAIGGRDGRAATLDGSFDVKLATPRELGGAGGEGVNPEQLFAAGYAACFLSALKLVAAQGGTKLSPEAAVTSHVGIGPREAGGYGLEVRLDVLIPGLERVAAETLVQKAHEVCPYSNATRNNIDVTTNVV